MKIDKWIDDPGQALLAQWIAQVHQQAPAQSVQVHHTAQTPTSGAIRQAGEALGAVWLERWPLLEGEEKPRPEGAPETWYDQYSPLPIEGTMLLGAGAVVVAGHSDRTGAKRPMADGLEFAHAVLEAKSARSDLHRKGRDANGRRAGPLHRVWTLLVDPHRAPGSERIDVALGAVEAHPDDVMTALEIIETRTHMDSWSGTARARVGQWLDATLPASSSWGLDVRLAMLREALTTPFPSDIVESEYAAQAWGLYAGLRCALDDVKANIAPISHWTHEGRKRVEKIANRYTMRATGQNAWMG